MESRRICVASPSVLCSPVAGWACFRSAGQPSGRRDGPGILESENELPLSTTVSPCNHLLREMTVALLCFLNLVRVLLLPSFNLEPHREWHSGEHSSQPHPSWHSTVWDSVLLNLSELLFPLQKTGDSNLPSYCKNKKCLSIAYQWVVSQVMSSVVTCYE